MSAKRIISNFNKLSFTDKLFGTINPLTLGMGCFGLYCSYYVFYDSYLQEKKHLMKQMQLNNIDNKAKNIPDERN